MCVSDYMKFQNRDGRLFFILLFFFLHGDNRKTVCSNEKSQGIPKIFKKC